MGKDRRRLPEIPKFQQYSNVLLGDERVHESVLVKEGGNRSLAIGLSILDLLQTPPDGTVTTLYDLLKRGVLISENGECVGERKKDGSYSWYRYEQVQVAHNVLNLFRLKPMRKESGRRCSAWEYELENRQGSASVGANLLANH